MEFPLSWELQSNMGGKFRFDMGTRKSHRHMSQMISSHLVFDQSVSLSTGRAENVAIDRKLDMGQDNDLPF